MIWVPQFFFAALTFVHLYLFANLRRAVGGGWWQVPVLLGLIASFAGAAFWLQAVRSDGDPLWTELFYHWLALLGMLAIFCLARDMLHLAAWAVDAATGAGAARVMAARWTFAAALLAGVAGYVYALHEANNPRIVKVTVKTPLLPEGRERLRIVAFSDPHVTRSTSPAWLGRLVGLVNDQDPDIVAVLGDLVDDRLADREDLADILAGLRAREGKFAVHGNHEVYDGLPQAEQFIARCGLTLLRGEVATAGGIDVVGVDDRHIKDRTPPAEAVRRADADRFVLLLLHQPETPRAAWGWFDLQLSGHTHGGQIWPVSLATRRVYGHSQGMTALPPGDGPKASRLFVSNGVGTLGPPVRFLAPPEIVVVDLIRE